MNLESFSLWVNDRWDKDPRSVRDKIALAGLGIVGEAAEISEPVKKWFYSGKPVDYFAIREELGDTLHYWVRLCHVFGMDPEEIMKANIAKLKERLPNGHAPVPHADAPLLTYQVKP